MLPSVQQKNLILLAMLAFSSQVFSDAIEAEQPLQEVFQSELVYPQEQGELQFTFSPEYADGDEHQQWSFPVVIEYGLTDALQVELEWTALVYHDEEGEDTTTGVGDLSIGAMYSWMNIGGQPMHAAVALELGIPTGNEDQELGEGHFTVEPFVILAWDLPFRSDTQVFLNAGVELSDSEEEVFTNLGFFTPIGDAIFTTEWNWSEEERYLTPGLVWQPHEGWELGLGVPLGLNSEADDFRFIFKLSYER